MNNLDKFRYSYDDPSQLNISLKKDPYEKVNDFKSNNLNPKGFRKGMVLLTRLKQ